jgi:predicted SAM-dependent methyltransferase
MGCNHVIGALMAFIALGQRAVSNHPAWFLIDLEKNYQVDQVVIASTFSIDVSTDSVVWKT